MIFNSFFKNREICTYNINFHTYEFMAIDERWETLFIVLWNNQVEVLNIKYHYYETCFKSSIHCKHSFIVWLKDHLFSFNKFILLTMFMFNLWDFYFSRKIQLNRGRISLKSRIVRTYCYDNTSTIKQTWKWIPFVSLIYNFTKIGKFYLNCKYYLNIN